MPFHERKPSTEQGLVKTGKREALKLDEKNDLTQVQQDEMQGSMPQKSPEPRTRESTLSLIIKPQNTLTEFDLIAPGFFRLIQGLIGALEQAVHTLTLIMFIRRHPDANGDMISHLRILMRKVHRLHR